MEKEIDISHYKNKSYFELIEIARAERNIAKRWKLFEYSDTVLQKETRKEIDKNLQGWNLL